MKKNHNYPAAKKICLGFFTAVMIFIVSSCSQKIAFQTSSVVPAARGTVKVKKDNNQNYTIKIQLTGLAEVKRLQPPKEFYVVWMESSQEPVKNLGQIKSSSSMLSKTLKASFESVTPIKPTRIYITAEDYATAQYPGGMVILTTDRF